MTVDPQNVSNKIGRKLAEGREAEVFEWQADDQLAGHAEYILKLYRKGSARNQVEHEINCATAAYEAGVSSPAVYPNVIEYNDRFGLINARVFGRDMLEVLSGGP